MFFLDDAIALFSKASPSIMSQLQWPGLEAGHSPICYFMAHARCPAAPGADGSGWYRAGGLQAGLHGTLTLTKAGKSAIPSFCEFSKDSRTKEPAQLLPVILDSDILNILPGLSRSPLA